MTGNTFPGFQNKLGKAFYGSKLVHTVGFNEAKIFSHPDNVTPTGNTMFRYFDTSQPFLQAVG